MVELGVGISSMPMISMESLAIPANHSCSVSWSTCCIFFLFSIIFPLFIERKDSPKITQWSASMITDQVRGKCSAHMAELWEEWKAMPLHRYRFRIAELLLR